MLKRKVYAEALCVTSYGTLFVGAILLPGGFVAFQFGGDSPSFLEALFYLILSAVLFICRVGLSLPGGTGVHKCLGGLLALAILIVPVFTIKGALRYIHQKTEHGLWVYKPETVIYGADGRGEINTIQINEFGFRGVGQRVIPKKTTVISLVGDSFIFGSGVPDNSTLAVALEDNIESQFEQAVVVTNFGHPGASLATAPKLTSYAVDKVAPELVVLLIQEGDLDWYDYNTRLTLVDESVLYRLLRRSNLEVIIHFAFAQSTALGFTVFSPQDVGSLLSDTLDACGKARLLVVTRLGSKASGTVQTWINSHPQVGWFNTSNDETWENVDLIPGDGHWSVEGTRELASSELLSEVISILNAPPKN
jgi:hypothetical protein